MIKALSVELAIRTCLENKTRLLTKAEYVEVLQGLASVIESRLLDADNWLAIPSPVNLAQPPLGDTQIVEGGIYQFAALPKSMIVPQKGVALITAKLFTAARGWVFYFKLKNSDGTWLHEDRGYACVSLYDVEFYPYTEQEKQNDTDSTIL